jgi:hypothetical protein
VLVSDLVFQERGLPLLKPAIRAAAVEAAAIRTPRSFWYSRNETPHTSSMHCSNVVNPQFVPPPSKPLQYAHHGVLGF